MSNYGNGQRRQGKPDNCFLSKTREKRSPNSPDYWGEIPLSQELIRYLAAQIRDGGEPVAKVALWRKENANGVYLSMNLSIPREAQQSSQRGGLDGRRVQPRAQSQQRQAQQNWIDEGDQTEDPFNDDIPF